VVSVLEQGLAAVVGESHFNVYDGYVTKSQLAKAIGRSSRTLDNWHRARTGPPRIKFGGVILYNLSSFKKWLAAQELAPGVRAKPQRSSPRGRPRKQTLATAAAE
jgi:hypothetical protein